MPDLIPGHARARFVAFGLMCIALVLAYSHAKAQTYTVGCGENVHAAIIAAGNPSLVTFAPNCTYRLTRRIDPKDGQTFDGNGATLNGAKVLPGTDNLWQKQGAYWYVDRQTQQGTRKSVAGETMCESGSPRCNYPELLFRNGIPLKHGGVLGEGDWYFDYTADRIYVYDDPAGQRMETSVTVLGQTNCAICGGANNVTVKNFRIEMFGTITESAAIEGFTPGGQNWLVENNTVEYNGAVGVVVRTGGVIRNNTLVRNGQAGYGAGGTLSVKATGIVIERNTVCFNNWKRVYPHFSSGGGKSSWTVGLIFRLNHVCENYKRGAWFDLDNSGTIIEDNTFERNDTALFLEMGGSAIVRRNTFYCNGNGVAGTFSTSILITNASGILIEDNTITVCATGNGIGVREDGNPNRLISGTRRPTDDIDIRDNRITFLACAGAVGQDAYNGGVLGRVTWERNIYTVKCATQQHWLVESVKLSFTEWVKLHPLEVLITDNPIPQPTATVTIAPTVSLTPTRTPEATETPAFYWRFEIEIKGWCLGC